MSSTRVRSWVVLLALALDLPGLELGTRTPDKTSATNSPTTALISFKNTLDKHLKLEFKLYLYMPHSHELSMESSPQLD